MLLVLLGQFLRAREICGQKTMVADLTNDEGVKKTLRIQGQAAGIMLCIEMVFELINYRESEEKQNGE